MKKRIQKIKQIEASGQIGMVEGVLINQQTAHKLLNNISNILLACGDLRILCKTLNW